MADFVLSVPDDEVGRITAALCGGFSINFYQSNVDPSPDAARSIMVSLLQQIVVQVEGAAAAAAIQPPALS